MSSFRRILSSRANAALSTGPKTAAGKRRSSQNGLRHGCRSSEFDQTLLAHESAKDFDAFLQEHLDVFQPRNDAEHAIIDRMVHARWRQTRVLAIETRMWNEAAQTASDLVTAFDIVSETPGFNSISRYEGACHQIYHRAVRELLEARKNGCTTEATLSFLKL